MAKDGRRGEKTYQSAVQMADRRVGNRAAESDKKCKKGGLVLAGKTSFKALKTLRLRL